MATQQERLQEWRNVAGETIRRSVRRNKRCVWTTALSSIRLSCCSGNAAESTTNLDHAALLFTGGSSKRQKKDSPNATLGSEREADTSRPKVNQLLLRDVQAQRRVLSSIQRERRHSDFDKKTLLGMRRLEAHRKPLI